MRGWFSVLVLALLLLSSVARAAAPSSVVGKAEELIERLERLEYKSVDVEHLVALVDRALELASQGRVGEALKILEKASREVEALERMAGQVHLRALVLKYSKAAILLLVPLLVYLGLPRLYLLAWYASRRRWLVRRAGR